MMLNLLFSCRQGTPAAHEPFSIGRSMNDPLNYQTQYCLPCTTQATRLVQQGEALNWCFFPAPYCAERTRALQHLSCTADTRTSTDPSGRPTVRKIVPL